MRAEGLKHRVFALHVRVEKLSRATLQETEAISK
jgi:hypothetical protein